MAEFTETITVEENNELLYFKVEFNDYESFEETLSLIISAKCVFDAEEMGEWKVL